MNDHKTTDVMDERAPSKVGNDRSDDALSASESMILDALERLADATDDIAHRLIVNLDEMREDFQHDWKGTRAEIKKMQEAKVEELQEAATVIRQAVDSGDEAQRAREQAIRSTLAESLDGLLDHVDKSIQSGTTKLSEQVAKFAEDQQNESSRISVEAKDRLHDAVESIQGQLKSQGETSQENLDSFASKLFEKLDAMAKTYEERAQDLQRRFDEAREESQKRQEEIENKLDQLADAIQKEQRERLEEQNRSIENLKSSVDRTTGELTDVVNQTTAAVSSAIEAAAQRSDEKLSSMAEESRRLKEMGAKMEESHRSIQGFFEQEQDRAQRHEEAQQREEARRLNNAGVSRFHAGEFKQAAELFEQAVEKDQHFAEAFNNLGLCYTELNDHDEATVAFETAIELNPDLGAGYNNLGYVLFRRENYEAAIEMYKEAIGHSHDTSAAYTNLGNAYQKTGQIEKAVASWEMALQADQGNERARRYLQRYTGGMSPEDEATDAKDDSQP